MLNKLSKQWIYLVIKDLLGFISRKNNFKIMNGLMPREQNLEHQISMSGPVQCTRISTLYTYYVKRLRDNRSELQGSGSLSFFVKLILNTL